jgi:hypothetical protein
VATEDNTQPWNLASGRSLSELLEVKDLTTSGGCRWRRGACPASESDRIAAAAWLVAEEIMTLRCGSAHEILDGWRAVAMGNSPEGVDPSLAAPFVEPTFGAPPDGGSEDHAQGYVAEVVWRMLANEEQASHRLVIHLERPDSDVTAPGADGFAIYRLHPSNALVFRLWEIKKRVGSGAVSATIGSGYLQLDEHAERYLAKLTGQSEAPRMDPAVAQLMNDLVPAWKTADPAAGAGVAVASDAEGLPQTAFSTMHKHFPQLVPAGGIEGCLVGVGSLRDFATAVRGHLWNGLSTKTT